ncbi:cytochrome c oxidase assembly protein [Actinophytocola glycyrrhizae]|uniref:Cytochrome c oxidase assembly protein n=1 Tax=Actinophytocola glycyrrhizae TaxID=2044873 RepID=A0ABV9SEG8_9PSEU
MTMPAVLPLAHGGGGGDAERWWQIAAILAITGVGAAYGRGVQELWHRARVGAGISPPRAAAFAAGLAVLLLAQLPPLHTIAEESFAGHMGQHMVLMVVAGPLLALGGAGLPLTMALPVGARRVVARLRSGALGRWLRQPIRRVLVVGVLHTGVLWFWHLPAPYTAALHSPAVHAVEHLSFVAAAWLLWSAVLAPSRHRVNGGMAFLLLFGVGMTGAALGAVLTFAPAPLYPGHALAPSGGDPLTDQQLAGLVMWIPMDMVVLALALSVFVRWLTGLEHGTPGDRALPARGPGPPAPAEEVTTR